MNPMLVPSECKDTTFANWRTRLYYASRIDPSGITHRNVDGLQGLGCMPMSNLQTTFKAGAALPRRSPAQLEFLSKRDPVHLWTLYCLHQKLIYEQINPLLGCEVLVKRNMN